MEKLIPIISEIQVHFMIIKGNHPSIWCQFISQSPYDCCRRISINRYDSIFMQEKVLSFKALLESSSCQKVKELLPVDPYKFSCAKFKAKNNMLNLLIKKENITKIWTNLEKLLTLKHKKLVVRTKGSVAIL